MSESSHESPRGFDIRSSIPVLRMFDEAKAKAFYLAYLGLDDWEFRARHHCICRSIRRCHPSSQWASKDAQAALGGYQLFPSSDCKRRLM